MGGGLWVKENYPAPCMVLLYEQEKVHLSRDRTTRGVPSSWWSQSGTRIHSTATAAPSPKCSDVTPEHRRQRQVGAGGERPAGNCEVCTLQPQPEPHPDTTFSFWSCMDLNPKARCITCCMNQVNSHVFLGLSFLIGTEAPAFWMLAWAVRI